MFCMVHRPSHGKMSISIWLDAPGRLFASCSHLVGGGALFRNADRRGHRAKRVNALRSRVGKLAPRSVATHAWLIPHVGHRPSQDDDRTWGTLHRCVARGPRAGRPARAGGFIKIISPGRTNSHRLRRWGARGTCENCQCHVYCTTVHGPPIGRKPKTGRGTDGTVETAQSRDTGPHGDVRA
jgi:hypothetical protein